MSARPVVLVVDDEPQIQRILKPGLAAGGFDVIASENGEDAVRTIARRAPDVVVLDLGLPDMDGMDGDRESAGMVSGPDHRAVGA